MTSRDIQHLLFNQFGDASQLMVPNYTPAGWFECDLFRITKAGFAEEFEIKLSVADFKVDAKKGPDEHEKARMAILPENSRWRKGFDPRSKHERLADGEAKGPRRFWFVMPEEIAAKVEIPPWAGLLTVRIWRGKPYLNGISAMDTERYKKAPILHKQKVAGEVSSNVMRVFYYRYWIIRCGLPEPVTDPQPA